jgi:hypothetical protein
MKATLPAIAVGLLACLAQARADGPPAKDPVPADFKVQVASFGVAKEPVYTEEVVIRSGKIYVFPSNVKEVTIIEPARGRLDLVDTGRKCQSEITFQTLDESMVKLKKSLLEAAENLEKQGGKAKIVEARMARDLFETKLDPTHDLKLNRVRLKNPAVEVDADGEPEADAARLSLVTSALVNIARLGAYRTPNDLPPFVELETLAALTGERKLRPTSITYLYRLAGPPQKMRRTYKLVPSLTDREIEAISRIDRFREVVPTLRYEQFRLDR